MAYKFPKNKGKGNRTLLGPEIAVICLEEGKKIHTMKTIKEDCFCPLATALRCPVLQKKGLI